MAVNQRTGTIRTLGKVKRQIGIWRQEEAERIRIMRQEKIRIRLIPVWLKLVIMAVLIVISLMGGAAVGYGVLGKGNMADVFKISTWTHIYDLVNKQ